MKATKMFLLPVLVLLFALSSCSSDNDEPKNKCSFKFVYDQNMIGQDAFAQSVSSVSVWAFNEKGKLVWSKTEKVAKADADNFTISANLPTGEYDVVTWCNLPSDMKLVQNMNPSNISELLLSLPLASNSGTKVCDKEIPGILNGSLTHISVSDSENAVNNFTLNLKKAVKNIRVVLQSNAVVLNPDDYEFSIVDCPNALEWNMTPKYSETFSYAPFSQLNEVQGMSVVAADFTTLCFNADSQAKLTITNKQTGVTENISLVPMILQNKPYEAKNMTDQEYLDCQDNYSMVFFVQ